MSRVWEGERVIAAFFSVASYRSRRSPPGAYSLRIFDKTPSTKRITTCENMAAMKTLAIVLPEPKYREEDIRKASSRQDDDHSPAIETRITFKTSGAPPPYGQ